eukprot:CAMPEP_0114606480 /NCGR_PEP_ID=MMETSP0168-20121206/1586_1 /TAXON_ID=95228 ORGANISM="Vannella sp., Strain DIVA3 517/6/12" /NCGR_SAMPLE_ID=MMETSP0168 /ASSEMBLY_ACC=CAM_ASM_000044 /LENGTH=474 /DNA_ID=CAMNT_0001817351 /DNA_START=131 /DNA_END=1552 /DNA_ORIENTATION=+
MPVPDSAEPPCDGILEAAQPLPAKPITAVGPREAVARLWAALQSLDGELRLQQRPFDHLEKLRPKHALEFPFWVLRGAGQVVFLNNPLSGALILAAITWEQWFMGLCGILALVISTAFGVLLDCDLPALRNGLIGYNALILAEGMVVFSAAPQWVIVIQVVLCSCAVVAVLRAWARLATTWELPALTVPFNVMLLTFVAASVQYTHAPVDPSKVVPTVSYAAELVPLGDVHWTAVKLLKGAVIGVGQVFFVATLWPSVLILTASVVCSRVLGLALLGGSLCGSLMAVSMGVAKAAVYAGLSGYNSSLTAAAVMFFFMPSLPLVALCLFAVMLTVLFDGALGVLLSHFGLPTGTLPFCIGTTIILLQTTRWCKRLPREDLSTPEAHIHAPKWLSCCKRRPRAAADLPPTQRPTVELQLATDPKEVLHRSLEEAYNAPNVEIDTLRALVAHDATLSGSDKDLLLRSLEEEQSLDDL